METVTVRQRWCLRRLGYTAPLFLALGKEVPRYVVEEDAGRLVTTFEIIPRGMLNFIPPAFRDVFPQAWRLFSFSGAVNFDAVMGQVDCYQDGATYPNHFRRYRVPDWPVERENKPLPPDLSSLLEMTLRPGGLPGVLADWVDERSGEFARFTQCLRHGRRLDEDDPASGFGFRQFRFRVASENVLFWSANGSSSHLQNPPPQLPLIGIGLFGEGGLQQKWEFVLDRELVSEFGDVAAAWLDFPDPDPTLDPNDESQ